jgi:glycosyl transferase family 11
MCNKIIVRLAGGLGNQLFCYAAARRLAVLNDAELVIDDVSGFSNDYNYLRFSQVENFNIPFRKARRRELLVPFPRLRRKILKLVNSLRDFYDRRYLTQEFIQFDKRLLDYRFNGTIFLEGYWQSESYFQDISNVIKEDLRITPPTDKVNHNLADKIRGTTSVAIHVRFFDKPGEAKRGNNVAGGYYAQAITYLEETHADCHYFLFSDVPEKALELLQVDPQKVTVVDCNKGDGSAYADLWLMSLCKHFIIANSTFSWWGAWLSNYSEKTVISPGRIRGNVTEWGFDGLIPEGWKIICPELKGI